jgi:hypothetical protein
MGTPQRSLEEIASPAGRSGAVVFLRRRATMLAEYNLQLRLELISPKPHHVAMARSGGTSSPTLWVARGLTVTRRCNCLTTGGMYVVDLVVAADTALWVTHWKAKGLKRAPDETPPCGKAWQTSLPGLSGGRKCRWLRPAGRSAERRFILWGTEQNGVRVGCEPAFQRGDRSARKTRLHVR